MNKIKTVIKILFVFLLCIFNALSYSADKIKSAPEKKVRKNKNTREKAVKIKARVAEIKSKIFKKRKSAEKNKFIQRLDYKVVYLSFIYNSSDPNFNFIKTTIPNSIKIAFEKKGFITTKSKKGAIKSINDENNLIKIGKTSNANFVLYGEYTILNKSGVKSVDFTVYIYDVDKKSLASKINILGEISIGIFNLIDRATRILKKDIISYSIRKKKKQELKRLKQLALKREKKRKQEQRKRLKERNKRKSKIYQRSHVAPAGKFSFSFSIYNFSNDSEMYISGSLAKKTNQRNLGVNAKMGIGLGRKLEINVSFNFIPFRSFDNVIDPVYTELYFNPELSVLWGILSGDKNKVNLTFKFGFQPKLSKKFLAGPFYDISRFSISSAWSFNTGLFFNVSLGFLTFFINPQFSYQLLTEGYLLHYYKYGTMLLKGFPEASDRHHFDVNVETGFDLKITRAFILRLGFILSYISGIDLIMNPLAGDGEIIIEPILDYAVFCWLIFNLSGNSTLIFKASYIFDNDYTYGEGAPGAVSIGNNIKVSNSFTVSINFNFLL